MTAKHKTARLTVVEPRGAAHLEFDVESISRLAESVWLIGQLLMESKQGFEGTGPALKQLAEEIQRYTKLVEEGLQALPA
jgi:hypothetical protein